MEEIIEDELINNDEFVIPTVYIFDELTHEYLSCCQADIDNAESIIQKRFVPLVNANQTLIEPPEVGENQIQVYSKIIETHKEPYEVIEKWNIESDYRKNFLKVDNELNVTDITTIGEQTGYIVVDKATGEDIKVNKDWYKIVNNEVVKKSDDEYEQEQADRRETEFNKAFFNTSLGYIRRSVTMQDGSKKDFLSDLLPVISMGVQGGMPVNILAYDKPLFDEDVEDWTEYQHQVVVTPQFIQECFLQLSNDFLPINEENNENTTDQSEL